MDKHNIILSENGEPDFSNCTSEHIKNKFQNNPWVKYALIQRELDFGYPHLEHQRKMQIDSKNTATQAKGAFEAHRADDSAEKERLRKLRESTKSEIDSEIGFNVAEGVKRTDELEGEIKASVLNPNELIHGAEYRLDLSNILMESFDERILRLEKKWFDERMKQVDSGVNTLTEDEIQERNQAMINRIRRIKMKVEQEALKRGEARLFEEHQILTEDEIMAESVPLERLINYFSLPKEQRQSNPKDDYEFSKSMRYIRRKELVEDLSDPTNVNQDTELHFEDATLHVSEVDSEKVHKQALDETDAQMGKEAEIKNRVQERGIKRGSHKESQSMNDRSNKKGFIQYLKRRLHNT